MRFCGNFYFTLRYCGLQNQAVCGVNTILGNLQFAVFCCYSVRCLYLILCGFAVFVSPLCPPQGEVPAFIDYRYIKGNHLQYSYTYSWVRENEESHEP